MTKTSVPRKLTARSKSSTSKPTPSRKPVKNTEKKVTKKAEKVQHSAGKGSSTKKLSIKGTAFSSPRQRSAKSSAGAAQKMLKMALKVLDDNKAESVVVIDLAGKSAIADYMVIASGRSQRHVASLSDHLHKMLKAGGIKPLNIEGARQGDWVLVDGGDIIIHLFRPEVREFYNLEKMWGASLPKHEE